MQVPSGEGERRAQRGYVPQYDLGRMLSTRSWPPVDCSGLGSRTVVPDHSMTLFSGLSDRISAYQ